jgi:Ca-activated chloride channel family protein
MSFIESFHFLRPGWLLLLLPAAWVLWRLWQRQDPARQLRALVRAELLEHLALEADGARGRLRPIYLLAALWLLGVVAVAGPAWRKEEAPFGEERSALFVVLKVTPTMAAQDVQPSRGERAVHKLGELLERRAGGQVGLVAYAGSAHLVMPLTRDAEIIRYFAAELDPAVMPREGDDPLAAVRLAATRLGEAGIPGSILLIADAVPDIALAGLEDVHETSAFDVHVYGVAAGPDVVPPAGSPPAPYLDEDSMRRAARAGGGRFVAVRPDAGDLEALDGNLTRSIKAASAQQGERWRDEGYYLVWLIAALSLLFWRRGGGVPLGVSS